MPAPPAVETKPPSTPEVLNTKPQVPEPPKPQRARRPRPKPPQQAPAEEARMNAEVLPTGPPAPAPVQFAPLLSENDKRRYTSAINDLLNRTNRNLAAVAGRVLTPQQTELVQQAKAFVVQCNEVRGRDLVAAKSLAERAEILSRHVLRK